MSDSPREPNTEPRQLDTTLVRALAALLVTNSHLEHFYPYPWLAGDGLVGNSLFFLLAGYGLVRSEQIGARPFGTWLRRRVGRIYPTLVPVVLVFGLLVGGQWRSWSIGDYLTNLIWPTGYTFVQLVMPFYVLFFLFLRVGTPSLYVGGMYSVALVYAASYAFDVRHLATDAPLHLGQRFVGVHAAAYFQVMLLGGWLATTRGDRNPSIAARPTVLLAIGLVYLAAKLAMVKGFGALAYPLLHVLTFGICFSTFAVLTSDRILRWVRSISPAWTAATFVGGLTLEIYLVHSYTAQYEWLWRVVFPANLGVFWLLTLPLAACAGWVGARLQRSVGKRRTGAPRKRSSSRPDDDLGVPARNTRK